MEFEIETKRIIDRHRWWARSGHYPWSGSDCMLELNPLVRIRRGINDQNQWWSQWYENKCIEFAIRGPVKWARLKGQDERDRWMHYEKAYHKFSHDGARMMVEWHERKKERKKFRWVSMSLFETRWNHETMNETNCLGTEGRWILRHIFAGLRLGMMSGFRTRPEQPNRSNPILFGSVISKKSRPKTDPTRTRTRPEPRLTVAQVERQTVRRQTDWRVRLHICIL